ncbi:DUF6282 family protein [Bacilliculturomica massiliensis]|uniref:DUF6282 family protein n=1 Tax=Bacilliculturomica massiliensis TaxID=1917867 RepID=UPI0010315EFB|nr:DUF6282 family protein [Bacilliculturomica massiliensis]
MSKADELLLGAIDMHCHGFPEFSLEFPNRFSDRETVQMMKDAGMGGVVFKSHFYPTTTTAYYLSKEFSDFGIYASITLNAAAGGCNIWAVEAAHKLGAKVVYLPTWSARNDQRKNSICRLIEPYLPTLASFTEADGYTVFGEDGQVSKKLLEILSFVREKDMVLFTGHIAPEESIALARAAKEMGYKKLVMNHPDSGSVGAKREQIKTAAELGAFIEICALGITPMYYRLPLDEMKSMIDMAGADRCILTTDYFFEWAAPVPEQLRQMIASLLIKGTAEEEIKKMTSENQRFLLGI